MHYFFLEKYSQPADWFEKRLSYTRSVAASSMVGVSYFDPICFLSESPRLEFCSLHFPPFNEVNSILST